MKVEVTQSCLTLCELTYSSWNSPGQNTGVGSLSLFQQIFPTQGLDPGLLHCRWILYQLSYRGSPTFNSNSSLIPIVFLSILSDFLPRQSVICKQRQFCVFFSNLYTFYFLFCLSAFSYYFQYDVEKWRCERTSLSNI